MGPAPRCGLRKVRALVSRNLRWVSSACTYASSSLAQLRISIIREEKLPQGDYICVTCEAAIKNPFNTTADAELLQQNARDLALFRCVMFRFKPWPSHCQVLT